MTDPAAKHTAAIEDLYRAVRDLNAVAATVTAAADDPLTTAAAADQYGESEADAYGAISRAFDRLRTAPTYILAAVAARLENIGDIGADVALEHIEAELDGRLHHAEQYPTDHPTTDGLDLPSYAS